MVHALVVKGVGINCEREMALAARMGGAKTDTVHLSHLLRGAVEWERYQLLLFPGGFSFGDELGAGKAFSNRVAHAAGGKMRSHLQRFVERGGAILGVCNGFQLLVKLGLLPSFGPQRLSLTANRSGRFESRWAHHTVLPSNSIFTRGIQQLYLPVRHAEGRLVASQPGLIDKLFEERLVALQYCDADGREAVSYPDNPNGSERAVAALTDRTGRILGMMAHPEGFLDRTHHPYWTALDPKGDTEGDGVKLFRNAVEALRRGE